ncbi:MAG: helix-hairpin-helix domain-containing protein [Bacteroidaceae bacterium]|nr:helix-hairpin-helix domain-containing protein [Bacteroidaceae bacterium]
MPPLPHDISTPCLPQHMARRCSMLFASMLFSLTVVSQTPMTWDEFVENTFDTHIIADNNAGSDEEAVTDETIDHLYHLQQNKINLNHTDAEQLRQLPFLSALQIEAIIYYLNRNHPMQSLGELMLIPELDYNTRRALMLFCQAGSVQTDDSTSFIRRIISVPSHEITVRTDLPLYIKAGYRNQPDSILLKHPNRTYLGNNNYHSLRYRINASNHLRAGLQVEKDGGEREFDYLSAWLMLRNIGCLKTVVAGDYRLSFGQGLVMNTGGMTFGKLSMLISDTYSARGIVPHSSITESGYLRGVAACIALSPTVNINPFVSYHDHDATFAADSASVTSFKTDGLHRTRLERSKRSVVHNLTFGANISVLTHAFNLSLTASQSRLSLPLKPKADTPATAYRRYNLHGRQFGAIGLSYGYRLNSLSFVGETAVCTQNGSIATTLTTRFHASSATMLMLNLRHFDRSYAYIYSKSMGEHSNVQNESGVTLALKCEPFTHLSVEAYADLFRFPYSTSTATGASQGFDLHTQITYAASKKSTFQLRYRLKSKQQDSNTADMSTASAASSTPLLYYHTNQTLRLAHTLQATQFVALRSTVSFTHRFNPDSDNELGYMFAEHIGYDSSDGRFRFDIAAAYFHTDSYAARLYAYEPSLLYSMGMTAYYNHGIRLTALADIALQSNLHLSCRVAHTRYFDRHTIGSALELINHSHREDLSLQLRWLIR